MVKLYLNFKALVLKKLDYGISILVFLCFSLPVVNDLNIDSGENFKFFKTGSVVKIDRDYPPLILLVDENTPLINDIFSNLEERPVNVSEARVDKMLQSLMTPLTLNIKNSDNYHLPVSSRFANDWNKFRKNTVQEHWSSRSRLAQQSHNRADFNNTNFNNTEPSKQRWINNRVWVGLPGESPKPNKNNENIDVVFSNLVKNSKRKHANAEFNKGLDRVIGSSNNVEKYNNTNFQTNTLSSKTLSPTNSDPLTTVTGNITLTDGLAFLGGLNNLKVYQVSGGKVVSEGAIDNSSGTYSIDIDSNSDGILVAELIDDTNIPIGYAEYLLDELTSNFDIYIKPVIKGFAKNIYYMDTDGVTNVLNTQASIMGFDEDIRVDVNGVYSIPKLSGGSSFLSLLNIENWKTFFWSSNNTDSMVVPGTSVLESLNNVDLDFDIREGGVIWGCLSNNKDEVYIELADRDAIGPLYLNNGGEFVYSNRGLLDTGCFAYYDVPDGIHLLRARVGEYATNVKVFDVVSGHITSLNISDRNVVNKKIAIFDSETGDILDSDLSYIGSDEIWSTDSGRADIKFTKSNEPLHIEVQPYGIGYLPIRVTTSADDDVLSIRVPSKEWLWELASYYRITDYPDLSIVVSYIHDLDIEPSINLMNDKTVAVFFDENFDPVDADSDRVKGFVIFNANPGVHSIKYLDNYNNSTIKTFIADPNYLNVIL